MPSDLQDILKLRVPVIVRLAHRRMPMSEVLGLSSGAIIEMPRDADDSLELMVNNKTIGAGVAVKVGENFGLRVNRIGHPAQRVEAMGEQASSDDTCSDAPSESD